MDIPTPAELVEKIDRFIAQHDIAETRFGRDAVGDPNLLSDLREGKRLPGLRKLLRISEFMERTDAQRAGGDHGELDTDQALAPSAEKDGVNSRQAVHHA